MSPTKLLIEAVALALLAAPAALAEPASAEAGTSKPVAAQVDPAGEPSPAPAEMDPSVELSPAPSDASGPAQAGAPMEGAAPVTDAAAAAEPVAMASDGAGAESETAMPAEAPAPELDETAVERESVDAAEAASWDGESPAAMDPGAGWDPSDGETADGAMEETPPLGNIGYDAQGRRGRIHVVVARDTLWDISDAYLGTPWVWPSIWQDNEDIENPHLIHPGDHIWITPNEMRRVTPEEAARLMATRPDTGSPAAAEDLPPEPAPSEPGPEMVAEPVDRGSYRVSSRESAGLITPEQLEASASIVDRVPERVLMSQEDEVYIGLGEGDVEVGDQLTIFRSNKKVFDPDTGRLLGYHVDFLGWLEVRETFPESSKASIRMSTGEIEVTDRVMPREPLPAEIAIQAPPLDLEGKISFFPDKRVLMGYNDFVYLNRGTLDGLEIGSPLEVYRPGRMANESARHETVEVPDLVIAQMLVVRAEAESSVALVLRSKTELALGDRFRGAE